MRSPTSTRQSVAATVEKFSALTAEAPVTSSSSTAVPMKRLFYRSTALAWQRGEKANASNGSRNGTVDPSGTGHYENGFTKPDGNGSGKLVYNTKLSYKQSDTNSPPTPDNVTDGAALEQAKEEEAAMSFPAHDHSSTDKTKPVMMSQRSARTLGESTENEATEETKPTQQATAEPSVAQGATDKSRQQVRSWQVSTPRPASRPSSAQGERTSRPSTPLDAGPRSILKNSRRRAQSPSALAALHKTVLTISQNLENSAHGGRKRITFAEEDIILNDLPKQDPQPIHMRNYYGYRSRPGSEERHRHRSASPQWTAQPPMRPNAATTRRSRPLVGSQRAVDRPAENDTTGSATLASESINSAKGLNQTPTEEEIDLLWHQVRTGLQRSNSHSDQLVINHRPPAVKAAPRQSTLILTNPSNHRHLTTRGGHQRPVGDKPSYPSTRQHQKSLFHVQVARQNSASDMHGNRDGRPDATGEQYQVKSYSRMLEQLHDNEPAGGQLLTWPRTSSTTVSRQTSQQQLLSMGRKSSSQTILSQKSEPHSRSQRGMFCLSGDSPKALNLYASDCLIAKNTKHYQCVNALMFLSGGVRNATFIFL